MMSMVEIYVKQEALLDMAHLLAWDLLLVSCRADTTHTHDTSSEAKPGYGLIN